ncbi:PREDICTED: uncharacterized protein LOC107165338 [Diuraphis noxia]|uniref:uncharacterized protein LOC107165338 n=1 Tax=Diuraphis noxia TaxID=143948 RepID=UPI0007638D78|nr:PREDICTED: uncharacterized protein LOC107165338 [Diuraphis noxia]
MVSRFAIFSLFLISVNASLTGPTNILPTLPNAIIKSQNSQCQHDSLKLQFDLKNMTLWAQQMWDASAKQAVGLLSGNRFQLGDFDECLQVAKPIKAQYCLVDVKLDVPSQYSYADPLAREYDPLLPAWHKIYVRKLFFSPLVVNYLLIMVLLSLTIIATIFDYIVYSERTIWQWNQESKSADLIMCFSGRRAMQSLKNKNCVVRGLDLTPLCGTTTISMILIIIGHRWGFRLPGPLQNYEVNEQVFYDYFISIFTSHMDLLVDTFFAISGALMILILLDRLETSFINPFKVLVFKYFRLTPVYAVIIFFFATLQYKMGSGPLWESFIGTDKKNCQQTWWLSLLYLNNYVATDKMCGYHTWFMPCEFHFTIIGIGLGYILHKKPKIGMYLTSLLMAISIAIPFALTYIGQKSANIQFNMDFFFTNLISIVMLYSFYSPFFYFQDFMKNVLSWKPFIPLASLNFNAYMVNTILPVADTASRRTSDHFNIRNFMADAISDTVMCLTAGLFLYLLVERPFRLLITQLFVSKSRSNTNEKKNYISQAIESNRDYDKVLPTHHRM